MFYVLPVLCCVVYTSVGLSPEEGDSPLHSENIALVENGGARNQEGPESNQITY